MKQQNSAAKDLAKKKAKRTDAAGRSGFGASSATGKSNRISREDATDYVGRQGMGETSTSYLYSKDNSGYDSKAYKNSEARNNIARRKGISNEQTVPGAQAYARKRKQEMENLRKYPK
jgi:hypothetical protein